jgi:hypothetical protein
MNKGLKKFCGREEIFMKYKDNYVHPKFNNIKSNENHVLILS